MTEALGPAGDRWVPRDQGERDAVRRQLEKILAHALFKNSKRYPFLFRYLVEHTLEGDTERLKERTLGMEVFGRPADYDTNADPVVRITAGEVRKRIAQYYHEPGHESEIRIDVPPGSYVSEFRAPPVSAAAPAAVAPARRRPLVAASVLSLALLAVLAWLRPWSAPTALERFWAPVLDSPNAVLLCVGQPAAQSLTPAAAPAEDDPYLPASAAAARVPEGPLTVRDLHWARNQSVALSDATTLSRLAGLLESRGKPYHIRGEAATAFADLRDGPVVLIGAFNNDWTMRLTGQLRFTFAYDAGTDTLWIRDGDNPAHREWAVQMGQPYLKVAEDYAVISRVLDPTTDRILVVAAGIANYGTLAAGEFLTNPASIRSAVQKAPAGWDGKNIQVVISTKVIGGSSGPPRVLAVHFW